MKGVEKRDKACQILLVAETESYRTTSLAVAGEFHRGLEGRRQMFFQNVEIVVGIGLFLFPLLRLVVFTFEI